MAKQERNSISELIEQAKANGKAEHLTVKILRFEDVGDTARGVFVREESLDLEQFESPIQRYVLDTDAGLVSFTLGSATDKQVSGTFKPGDLVEVEYQGQREIGGGRSVNLWDIRRYGNITAEKGGDE